MKKQFCNQLIKQKIKNLHNIIYSHHHADQTHGINDLRVFYIKNKKKIDVYANKATKKYLLSNFSYCFKDQNNYPAILKLNLINKNSRKLKILGKGLIKSKVNIEADLASKSAVEKLEKIGGSIQLKKN